MQRIPLTQVQMIKSFNSLLIKFDVSTQETSCQNFFSSLLYVREFFLDNSLVQEIFSYAHALAGNFFSKSPNPPPPQKLNGWPLRGFITTSNLHGASSFGGVPRILASSFCKKNLQGTCLLFKY